MTVHGFRAGRREPPSPAGATVHLPGEELLNRMDQRLFY
jgi:hypothetical protein